MKNTAKRTLCALLALMLTLSLAACGGAKTVDPQTCTYDEMVAYLTAKGYIAKIGRASCRETVCLYV